MHTRDGRLLCCACGKLLAADPDIYELCDDCERDLRDSALSFGGIGTPAWRAAYKRALDRRLAVAQ